MASSFLASASKRVTDVRGFLRDAAGGSSIKYVAGKGEKHLIYIPYNNVTVTDENGEETVQKEVIALSGDVHEWRSPEGRFRATVCIKDVIRQNEDQTIMINDGSCPFCDRVSDAWDIYRYRKELEEANCKLVGEDRKKHLEKITSTLADERKAKDVRSYMYLLIVKYRTDSAGNVVIGQDKLPEYDLKVMKLSSSRIQKIQQQIANAGSDLPGSELIFEYPNSDDRRLVVSQSTTAPVFPQNMLINKFQGLLQKIENDVAKFEWDGIEKSFQEWNGMSTMEAKKIMDDMFEKWDNYKQQVLVNPNVKYMEYITDTPVTNPSIGDAPKIEVPTAAIPSSTEGQGVDAGGAPKVPSAPEMPPVPDANAVFGGDVAAPQIKI